MKAQASTSPVHPNRMRINVKLVEETSQNEWTKILSFRESANALPNQLHSNNPGFYFPKITRDTQTLTKQFERLKSYHTQVHPLYHTHALEICNRLYHFPQTQYFLTVL